MRVISFDVGIKNMAYCILEVGSQNIKIIDWNILNLMDREPTVETNSCNYILETKKSKKGVANKETDCSGKSSQSVVFVPPLAPQIQPETKLCMKQAKYKKENNCFCDKHAKICSFIIPNNECSLTKIKKMKVEELILFCNKHFLYTNESNIPLKDINKKEILFFIEKFIEKKVLEPIKKVKTKSASETDLITIGRNMTQLLNKLENIENITHVIIENQISPIANRMKTIQGMLCQYFIMKGIEGSGKICGAEGGANTTDRGETMEPEAESFRLTTEPKVELFGDNLSSKRSPKIEFISSANKLKGFGELLEKKKEPKENNPGNTMDKTKYKKNKMDGIMICSQFVENNDNLHKWKSCLLTSKKDDYADSFLQGIWYLKNIKAIDYNNYVIKKVSTK